MLFLSAISCCNEDIMFFKSDVECLLFNMNTLKDDALKYKTFLVHFDFVGTVKLLVFKYSRFLINFDKQVKDVIEGYF